MFSRPLVLTFSTLALIALCQATSPMFTTVEAQRRAAIRF